MTIDEIIQGLTGEHFYLNHEHIRHNAIKAAVVILKDYERIQKEYTPTTKNDLGVDAISRADAIRVASGYCHPSNVAKELAKLPSVAPQEPRWIPTSDRLPENKTYVLVTIGIPGRQPHARSGWYQDGFFHNDNGDCWRATDIEVKAWMPLPKPYEPQESEDAE